MQEAWVDWQEECEGKGSEGGEVRGAEFFDVYVYCVFHDCADGEHGEEPAGDEDEVHAIDDLAIWCAGFTDGGEERAGVELCFAYAEDGKGAERGEGEDDSGGE